MAEALPPWLLYREEPYQLASGRLSHFYVDAEQLFADERLRAAVLADWAALLDKGRFALLPVYQGGHRWAEALGERLGTRAEYGVPDDYDESDMTIVIVEDVLTTGETATMVTDKTYRDLNLHVAPLVLAVVARHRYLSLRYHAWAVIELPDWEPQPAAQERLPL